MHKRPNIVLILVDDMGYSDLGCFGGEIETPHLDALCAAGQGYTQFYNTARCCPSRASLLTGLNPHQAGIGHMTNDPENPMHYDKGLPGYRGFLNRNCVTLAEVLKDVGYHTYLSGKWHLGMHKRDQWPCQRGFERFYGLLPGACNYMQPDGPRCICRDNDGSVTLEPDFYSTNAFTDQAMQMLSEQGDDAPFFLYLAYNAPHWPLQAPEAYVQKYRGKYLEGWDAARERRYARMIENGIIAPEHCALSPRDPDVRDWDTLDDKQKDELDLRMATYAAQVDCMDHNVGRLITFLKERKQLDNTLILFLSDNGGCAEGGELGHGDPKKINQADLSTLFLSYGKCWANVSNTPFRQYKRYVHEGGIATPLIAHWPEGIRAGGLTHTPASLIDIMPTVLEISGAAYPLSYHGGQPIHPLAGKSLAPVFDTGTRQGHAYMYWEHEDNCSVRAGRYKALQKYDTGAWELYDLENDRSELHDLAAQHPDILEDLKNHWYDWAQSHCVIPKTPGWL